MPISTNQDCVPLGADTSVKGGCLTYPVNQHIALLGTKQHPEYFITYLLWETNSLHYISCQILKMPSDGALDLLYQGTKISQIFTGTLRGWVSYSYQGCNWCWWRSMHCISSMYRGSLYHQKHQEYNKFYSLGPEICLCYSWNFIMWRNPDILVLTRDRGLLRLIGLDPTSVDMVSLTLVMKGI